VLGCAQTGTGKTAAFALPILQRLLSGAVSRPPRGPAQPRALILAPTRELATQIGESFAAYGRHTSLRQAVIFGGVSQFHQVRALRDGVDIVIATPGRLLDLMEQRQVNLAHIGVFVLDEADRMLDMGFIAPIRRIAAALPHAPQRQTLLFSATMPREVTHLAEALLHGPVRVAVTPVSTAAPLIEQSVYMVPRPKKQALLRHLLAKHTVLRALVFTRTKHGAERLSRQLQSAGIAADAIHGNKAQNQRRRALENFRAGSARVLVATDVAARGLDVDGITHVFNFDLPDTPEAYVHRIGRTGRAGAAGVAMSFCDGEERDLLHAIEKLIGQRVPSGGDLPELPDVHVPAAARPGPAPRAARPSRCAPRAQPPAPGDSAGPAREPLQSWTRRLPSGRGGRRR
jgi:ATP-dependent RNA helicase RhlE